MIFIILEKINSLINVPITSNEKETYPTIITSFTTYIILHSNNKKSIIYDNGTIISENTIFTFTRNSFCVSSSNITFIISNITLYIIQNNENKSIEILDNYINYVSIIIKNDLTPMIFFCNITNTNIHIILMDSNSKFIEIISNFSLGNDASLLGSFYCDSFNYINSPICIFTYNKIVKIIQFYLSFDTNQIYYNNNIFNYSDILSQSSGAKFLNILNNENEKILCSISYNNGIIECLGLKRENEINFEIKYEKFTFLSNCNRHIKDFDIAFYNSNELLSCCSSYNKILCQKIEFNKVNFSLKGSIITLINNDNINENYIQPKIAFTLNKKWCDISFASETNELIYHYIISFPFCTNLTIPIEANQINKISLFEQIQPFLYSYMNKKTNDEFYISFTSIPDNSKVKLLYSENNDENYEEVKLYKKYEMKENSSLQIESLITDKEIYNTSFSYKLINKFDYESNECNFYLTIFKCHERCLICYLIPNETSENCILCNNNYYFSPFNDGNCYKISEKKDNWFFDYMTKRFYECNVSCNYYITINENNLIDCSNDNKYYPVENERNICLQKNTTLENYYFNSTNKQFQLCKEGCKNCTSENICESCEEDYYFIDLFKTCEKSSYILEGYYSDSDTKTFKKCNNQCKTCEINENNCLSCYNNYYVFEGNCFIECPINSIIKENSNINECERIDYFESNYSLSESFNIILNDFEKLAFIDYILKGNNFTFHIYYALNQSFAIKKSNEKTISYIKFNESQLNKFNENNIIITLERFSNYEKSFPKIDYFFLDENKQLIKINSKLIIYKIINDSLYEENLKKIKAIEYFKYNILNNNSEFFNDICSLFTNENKNDVLIEDRRKDYYEKSVCENNCLDFYFDDTLNLIICNCTIDNNYISNIFNNITKGLEDNKINLYQGKIFTKKIPSILSLQKCKKDFFSPSIWMDFFWLIIIIYIILIIKLFSSGFKNLLNFINIPNQNIKKTQMYNHFLFIKNRKKASNFSKLNNSSLMNINEESNPNPPLKTNERNINNNIIITEQINQIEQKNKKEETISNNNKKINQFYLDNIYSFSNREEINDPNICDNQNHYEVNISNNIYNNKIDSYKKSNLKQDFILNNKERGINYQLNSIIINNNIINQNNNEKNDKYQFEGYISPLKKVGNKNNNNGKKSKFFRNKGTILPLILNRNINNHTMFKKQSSTIISIDIDKLTYHEYNQLYLWEEVFYGERNFGIIFYGYLSEVHFFFNLFLCDSYFNIKLLKIIYFLLVLIIMLYFNTFLLNEKFIRYIYQRKKIKILMTIYNALLSRIFSIIICIPLKILINTNRNFENNIRNFKFHEEYKRKTKKGLTFLKMRIVIFIFIGFLIILYTWYYFRIHIHIFINSRKFILINWSVTILLSFFLSFILCFLLTINRIYSIKKKNKCLYNCNRFIVKYL